MKKNFLPTLNLQRHSLKGLQEQRNEKVSALQSIVDKAKVENRAMSEEENKEFEGLEKEIANIDKTIAYEVRAKGLGIIKNKEEKTENRAIITKLMNGENIDLSLEERAVTEGISTGGNTAVGTELVGKTYADSIVQKLAYVSPLYAATNKIVTGQPHQIPIQASKIGKFVKTAELGNYVAQNAAFGVKTLNAIKYTNMFVVSRELVEDSMYNIESELIGQTVEALASTLDELIVKGSSADGIEGLESVTTANGAKEEVCAGIKTIGVADIVNLFYALPIQYRNRATWIFNDKTAKLLSQLQTTDKKPLLYADYSNSPVGGQTTMLGRPVIINNNVADYDAATAVKAMFFVDLDRALTVGIRKGFEMIRSTEYGFLNDSIAVKSSIRLDIKTIVEEACAYLKTKIA